MPKIIFSVLFVLLTAISFGQSSKLVRGKIVDQKTSREIEELKIQIQNVKTKQVFKTSIVFYFWKKIVLKCVIIQNYTIP